jgi:hypothetical protein
MNPYDQMFQGAQQPNQQNYLSALGMGQKPQTPTGMPQLPNLSQGRPSYGPQGMPSNGQGPRPMPQMPQQAQGSPQGNPFLQAIARWHAGQQQGQPGGGMPFPGVQFGPQPVPQGMRAPASMPPAGAPPWAGQNVQWGPPVQMRQPPGPLAQNGPNNR